MDDAEHRPPEIFEPRPLTDAERQTEVLEKIASRLGEIEHSASVIRAWARFFGYLTLLYFVFAIVVAMVSGATRARMPDAQTTGAQTQRPASP